jgi:hypothetical protein
MFEEISMDNLIIFEVLGFELTVLTRQVLYH